MSPHSNRRAKNAPNTVRVDGRNFSIRDRIRINGRKYLLLARLSATPRERWFACDPSSGFQPRSILRLPGDNSTSQHVRSLRRLKSDSLPQIVDYQHHQKETLVALSWVRGISLCEYVQRFRSGKVDMPTPFHCVRLIRQLAHALNTMHKYANVIHGDLKPANLVITRKPGRLTLIDFGSAWPLDMTGVRCEGDGISRTYSAPELQGDQFGPPRDGVDQFSASVILYELLTDTIPYQDVGGRAGTPEFIAELGSTLTPPSGMTDRLNSLPPPLRRQLDDLVCRGLALHPQERFATTSAWLTEIENVFLQLQVDAAGLNRPDLWTRTLNWLADRFPPRQPQPSPNSRARS
jgi:serine/threonine protein kinase